MAAKILSQAGISLADVYDVKGSIAGIEQLESREVSLVHEMGATIFSERFSGAIRRGIASAVLQDTNFNVVLNDLPAGAVRVVGVQIFTDNAARLARAAVVIRSADGREMPIWVWDQTNSLGVDFEDNAGGVAQHTVLVPSLMSQVPSMLVGGGQPQIVGDVALRGKTTAFGAGDVTTIMILYLLLSQVGGLSSRGLPIPSW